MLEPTSSEPGQTERARPAYYRLQKPNQSCQSWPSTPGNSTNAPGSAFNTSGTAGGNYAGQQPQNSNNPNAVSQYDVACYQVSH